MKSDKKDFDAVSYMRQERDKISNEICNLAHEEIIQYFSKRRTSERLPKIDK